MSSIRADLMANFAKQKGLPHRNSPIFAPTVVGYELNQSAVRPERSIPCTKKFWQNRERMTSGAMITKPQVL